MAEPQTLDELNARIVECALCPRLRDYCAEVARTRKRMWADVKYWGRPVPSFGDERARVLALGLAPGAHGSNRTGRPFTGDGSGEFLFPTLYDAGFASQPRATGRDDGMKLTDLWISSVGRCAPPANKPTTEELTNCAPWLDREIALLFGHGVEYTLPGGLIVMASYHPSLQNTNTGKLTRPMFLKIFMRARTLAGLDR